MHLTREKVYQLFFGMEVTQIREINSIHTSRASECFDVVSFRL